MYAPRAVYGDENQYPMLVSDAHFQLAKAYAELKCVQQANDHCNRALEAMPTYGMPHDQIQKFRLDTNIMLAEMLLTSKPPKPRVREGGRTCVGLRQTEYVLCRRERLCVFVCV